MRYVWTQIFAVAVFLNFEYLFQSQYGDITGKLVADLGSGCGALTIGAAILDPVLVVGFEFDTDALEHCKQNILEHEVENIDLIQCNVLRDINDGYICMIIRSYLGITLFNF